MQVQKEEFEVLFLAFRRCRILVSVYPVCLFKYWSTYLELLLQCLLVLLPTSAIANVTFDQSMSRTTLLVLTNCTVQSGVWSMESVQKMGPETLSLSSLCLSNIMWVGNQTQYMTYQKRKYREILLPGSDISND